MNETAEEFGKSLKENTTLKFLDLENNDLTNQRQSSEGVKELASALAVNKTLLNINLSRTNMDAQCIESFIYNTEINKTLICFEFGGNEPTITQVKML